MTQMTHQDVLESLQKLKRHVKINKQINALLFGTPNTNPHESALNLNNFKNPEKIKHYLNVQHTIAEEIKTTTDDILRFIDNNEMSFKQTEYILNELTNILT